jgi:hypothetical protein
MSALNDTGIARINSVSCASPGYCTAGGSYGGSIQGTGYGQPFVVNEVNSIWRKAIPVPGVLALNTGKNGFISSVSCTRPGYCSAGGRYVGPKGSRPFVVNEVNGVWHNVITLPVTGVGDVEVSALACASPGNCSAAGTSSSVGTAAAGLEGTFVVNKVNGKWQKPIVIPGKPVFVYGSWVRSMACPTAGNCTAAGWYLDGGDKFQAFVASEVNGTWHNYITIPGTSAHPGSGAQVSALSCPKPGNCTVAGSYIGEAEFVGFLASEVNGTWHTARSVPGLANLYGSGGGQVTALSCTRPGDCSAGGWYHVRQDQGHPFVVSKVNGTWHNAHEVPGMSGLDPSGHGGINVLSCAGPGNCSAGGSYPGATSSQGFVVNEVNGTWHNAMKVPGMSALNLSGNSNVTALSCASPGDCSAGGYYHTISFGLEAGQVFVVNEG